MCWDERLNANVEKDQWVGSKKRSRGGKLGPPGHDEDHAERTDADHEELPYKCEPGETEEVGVTQIPNPSVVNHLWVSVKKTDRHHDKTK